MAMVNHVGQLIEYCVQNKDKFSTPVFSELKMTGPSNCPTFGLTCSVQCVPSGVFISEELNNIVGRSSKQLKHDVAQLLLVKLTSSSKTNQIEDDVPMSTNGVNYIGKLQEYCSRKDSKYSLPKYKLDMNGKPHQPKMTMSCRLTAHQGGQDFYKEITRTGLGSKNIKQELAMCVYKQITNSTGSTNSGQKRKIEDEDTDTLFDQRPATASRTGITGIRNLLTRQMKNGTTTNSELSVPATKSPNQNESSEPATSTNTDTVSKNVIGESHKMNSKATVVPPTFREQVQVPKTPEIRDSAVPLVPHNSRAQVETPNSQEIGGEGFNLGTTNYVAKLQIICQKKREDLPRYTVINTSGQPHARTFEMEIVFRGKRLIESQSGNQKNIRQKLAFRMLQAIENDDTSTSTADRDATSTITNLQKFMADEGLTKDEPDSNTVQKLIIKKFEPFEPAVKGTTYGCLSVDVKDETFVFGGACASLDESKTAADESCKDFINHLWNNL